MDEDVYSRLKNAIDNDDQLEGLSALGRTLDAVVDEISRSCIKNELDFLSESIAYQRTIYEKAGLLYESIQAEDMVKEDRIKILNDFDQSLKEYYEFSKCKRGR